MGNPIYTNIRGKDVTQMDAVKYVLGILVLILCVGLIGTAVWYCMFRLPDQAFPQGTLVFQSMPGGRLL
ncbi:MAG: hypothetical protein K2P02_04020 [Lachnospiraceae bacterium]|nr:hypothetical protein [Lachnospiraceae bacterium]